MPRAGRFAGSVQVMQVTGVGFILTLFVLSCLRPPPCVSSLLVAFCCRLLHTLAACAAAAPRCFVSTPGGWKPCCGARQSFTQTCPRRKWCSVLASLEARRGLCLLTEATRLTSCAWSMALCTICTLLPPHPYTYLAHAMEISATTWCTPLYELCSTCSRVCVACFDAFASSLEPVCTYLVCTDSH